MPEYLLLTGLIPLWKILPKQRNQQQFRWERKDFHCSPSTQLVHGSGLASLPDGNANAVDVTFRTVIIIIIIMVKGLTVLEEVAVDG